SILMVVYAIITEQSLGKIMMAGLIPKLITALAFMVGIYVRVKINPSLAPMPKEMISWEERFKSLSGVWRIAALFVLVIGGIYAGLFTPTYAGAIGAFGAFMIVLFRGRLTKKTMLEV